MVRWQLFGLLLLPLQLLAIAGQVGVMVLALTRLKNVAPAASLPLAAGAGCGALALTLSGLGTIVFSLLARLVGYQAEMWAMNGLHLLSVSLWVAAGVFSVMGVLKLAEGAPSPAAAADSASR